MYALDVLPCHSFLHAKISRLMLEADGFPAVAATVTADGDDIHVVMSISPHKYAHAIGAIAGEFAAEGDAGLVAVTKHVATLNSLSGIPEDWKPKLRGALLAAVRYAADDVVITESADATEVDTGKAHNDPGDEHTETTTAAPLDDKFDNWKPGRNLN